MFYDGREIDPKLSSFTSPDKNWKKQYHGSYNYCDADPVNKLDVNGQEPVTIGLGFLVLCGLAVVGKAVANILTGQGGDSFNNDPLPGTGVATPNAKTGDNPNDPKNYNPNLGETEKTMEYNELLVNDPKQTIPPIVKQLNDEMVRRYNGNMGAGNNNLILAYMIGNGGNNGFPAIYGDIHYTLQDENTFEYDQGRVNLIRNNLTDLVQWRLLVTQNGHYLPNTVLNRFDLLRTDIRVFLQRYTEGRVSPEDANPVFVQITEDINTNRSNIIPLNVRTILMRHLGTAIFIFALFNGAYRFQAFLEMLNEFN